MTPPPFKNKLNPMISPLTKVNNTQHPAGKQRSRWVSSPRFFKETLETVNGLRFRRFDDMKMLNDTIVEIDSQTTTLSETKKIAFDALWNAYAFFSSIAKHGDPSQIQIRTIQGTALLSDEALRTALKTDEA